MIATTTDYLDPFPKNTQTPSDEAALVIRISQGNESALNMLVMANMREALLYTSRTCRDEIDPQTRISLCYQEMMMSGKRFQSGRGRFFGFAKAGLRGRMKTYFSSLKPVRNATTIISTDAIESWVQPSRHGRSHQPVADDDDHEDSPRERVTGEVTGPQLDGIVARDHWRVIKKTLAKRLTAQQWMILDLVYISGMDFAQIAKLLDFTRAGVSIAHKNAIQKLRVGISRNKRLLI